MNNQIQLVKRTAEEWDALREGATIYELLLPNSKAASMIAGDYKECDMQLKSSKRYYYGTNIDRMFLKQVAACWENPKETIKVIIAGNGYSAIFSRDCRVVSYPGLTFDRWGSTNQDVYSNVKVGTWLFCPRNSSNEEKEFEISFILNGTKEEAIEALNILFKIDFLKEELRQFEWKEEQFHTKSDGTVYIEDVRAQKKIFDLSIRQFKWEARKEQWDLFNAVKAKLKQYEKNGKFCTEIDGLDGNKYFLECLPKSQVSEEITSESSSFGSGLKGSIFTMDYWLDFVYFKPDQYRSTLPQKEDLTEKYISSLVSVRNRIQGEIILGFGTKRVSLERKLNSNNATLTYANRRIMKDEKVFESIKDYFLTNKPLFPRKTVSKSGKIKMICISPEAQTLIDSGLNGEMEDLEGRLPFHLNLVYKERKWFIESAGKLYYVKGGISALTKIQTAIKGTAIVDHNKYPWREGGRSGTRVIKDRLAELVGEKNALEIVLNTKKMGALTKVMVGETN